LWPGQKRLLFSVSDSGSGISPQDTAKLFSPFWQLREHADGSDKGSGLGLSIAKNIVETMGGKIRLASRLGRGTSLWFDLPLLEAVAPIGPLAPEGMVALVEADRLLRLAVVSQLQSLGVQIQAFASVDELVAHFDQVPRPALSLYGFWPRREKADAALPHWLEWCQGRGLQPILLFPCGERTLLKAFSGQSPACQLAAEPEARPATSRRGLKLLVADDNEINRLLLKAQLSHFEADIVEACNGKQALEWLLRQRFDLVFLDLQMPLMDGLQVLQELRDHANPNRHTSIIAITAFCAAEQRDAILQEGFADCLTKPILQEHLNRVVVALLDARSRESTLETGAEGYARAILAKTGGNRDLATLIARKLFAELPQALRQIETAVGRRNREAARQVVHKINGSAAFSGLEALRLAAVAVESALSQGDDWEAVGGLCRNLASETETLLAAERVILDLLGRSHMAAIG
jgi:two-component system sensor histidine kinase BarA